MSTYANLDHEIIKAITAGVHHFYELESARAVRDEAQALAAASPRDQRGDRRPAFRFIDARLQALRKAGKLTYDRKAGWKVA